MANALYNSARQAFLDGDLDWTAQAFKVVLIDTADYTFSQTHDFLDDVPSAARVATSGNLANKTSTAGVADADDIVFTAVTGDPCEALIIYQDTGTAATSRLVAYIDTVTGFPVTPNGGDIYVTWDSGSNKIFRL